MSRASGNADQHRLVTSDHERIALLENAIVRLSDRIARIEGVGDEVMRGDFFAGSEPYRIWWDLPKVVIVPKPKPPKRRWWQGH